MRKTLTITLASLAGSAALIGGLAGCGGSSAKVGQAPPAQQATAGQPVYAANVLADDGYTVDPATSVDGSPVLAGLGLSGRASGTRGDRAEQVLVFAGGHPSAPACKETAVCTSAGLAAQVVKDDPGVTVRVDGLVLRVTGTKATFLKDGLPV